MYIRTPHPPLEPSPVPGLLKILPEITAELFLLFDTSPLPRSEGNRAPWRRKTAWTSPKEVSITGKGEKVRVRGDIERVDMS